MNAANTNVCRSGYSKIADVPTCSAAAKALGKTYVNFETNSFYPSGCYNTASNGQVVLNLDPTGAADPGYQPLCKITGEPLSGPNTRLANGAAWGIPCVSTAGARPVRTA